jgi:hypothetical protein
MFHFACIKCTVCFRVLIEREWDEGNRKRTRQLVVCGVYSDARQRCQCYNKLFMAKMFRCREVAYVVETPFKYNVQQIRQM